MPLSQTFSTPNHRVFLNRFARSAILGSLFLLPSTHAIAQTWDRNNPGVFIYQRDVPTQPAQVVGEPAPPDQVILSGPDSPFDSVMHIGSALSDLEAGAISAQLPATLDLILPGAPPSSTDPQDMVGYAGALASTVTTATQGSVTETVNQTTALLNSTTAMIGNVLGKLPTPGEF